MSNNGRIITENINQEFKKIKAESSSKEHGGGYQLKSAILEKSDLPKRVQKKMANVSVGGGAMGAMGNIRNGSASFYHPLFQNMNMMLPRDRRERNEWCRHFYRTEPIIATSLDLHTEFPISDFNNVCFDTGIKEFFDYMAFDRLSMVKLLLDIGLEYWKIGDVFPFGQLSETDGMWERFVLLNPDYVDIKASLLAGDSILELLPDEQIKAIVMAGPRGEYSDIFAQLPEDVIRQVRSGRNIKLDNRLVSHISHKASQYETWGTPIMMRCFKTLIYKDKLREAQNSIANRHVTPLRIFKVGAPGEPYPAQEDLDNLRDMLMSAEDDPNFMLVYHYALQTDYVGSSGKILPLNQEFDFIQKELMNGMGINQAMLNGDGPTYANAQVGMDTLAKRYMSYRLVLEDWIKKKVYRPIAEIQGFYKPEPSEIAHGYRIANRKDRQLIVPEISWQQQDLTSNQAVLNFVQQLQAKGLVSMHTILPMLNLDPETEKKNLETERGTVFDPNAPKTGALSPMGTLPGGAGGPGGPPPAPGAPSPGGPASPGGPGTPPGVPGPPARPAVPGPGGNTPPAPGGAPGAKPPGAGPSPTQFGFPGGGPKPATPAPSPNNAPPPPGAGRPTPAPAAGGRPQASTNGESMVKQADFRDFLEGTENSEEKSHTVPRSSITIKRQTQESEKEPTE